MRKLSMFSILLAAIALGGCRSQHLVFTTYTKVGLDVSTTNGQLANGTFGYKRFEGAIIPVDESSTAGNPEDAKSVFAGIAIRNGWLRGLELRQVFGTGQAAVDLSRRNAQFLGKVLDLDSSNDSSGSQGTEESEESEEPEVSDDEDPS